MCDSLCEFHPRVYACVVHRRRCSWSHCMFRLPAHDRERCWPVGLDPELVTRAPQPASAALLHIFRPWGTPAPRLMKLARSSASASCRLRLIVLPKCCQWSRAGIVRAQKHPGLRPAAAGPRLQPSKCRAKIATAQEYMSTELLFIFFNLALACSSTTLFNVRFHDESRCARAPHDVRGERWFRPPWSAG